MAKAMKRTSEKKRNYNSLVSKTALKKAKGDIELKHLSIWNVAKKWNSSKITLHDYMIQKHKGSRLTNSAK